MNKYLFLSTLFVWSALHAVEREQKQKKAAIEVDGKEAAIYSPYGVTEELIVTCYCNDSILSKKRLTAIGLIPHTSYVLVGTHNGGAIVVDTQREKSDTLISDNQELSQALITSVACGSYTNRIAYATLKRIAIGTLTLLKPSKYCYDLTSDYLQDPIHTLAFDPTDSAVAGGCDDGVVRIWDLGKAQEAFKIESMRVATTPRIIPIFTLAYLDNYTICYNSQSRGIVVHDIRSKEKTIFEDRHAGLVRALSASITSKRIISGGSDGTVNLYDARSSKVLEKLTLATKSPVTCVALHPSFTEEFWAGQEDGACHLIRSKNGSLEIQGNLCAHKAPVSALAVSAYTQDYCAASVGWDGAINFYGSKIKLLKTKKRKVRIENIT